MNSYVTLSFSLSLHLSALFFFCHDHLRSLTIDCFSIAVCQTTMNKHEQITEVFVLSCIESLSVCGCLSMLSGPACQKTEVKLRSRCTVFLFVSSPGPLIKVPIPSFPYCLSPLSFHFYNYHYKNNRFLAAFVPWTVGLECSVFYPK